jgi:PAS domain S-box-containing protein
MRFLKRLLAPPVFDDELEIQQAYMLNIILWTLIVVPIPYVIYTLALHPEDSLRSLIQAGFGEFVNILLLVALHRGFVKAASAVQVGAFWLFFTVTAFTGNGVQGEAYLIGYTLAITVAGILLGGSGALLVTILSLISGAFMVTLQMHGRLEGGFTSSPLSTWVVSLVLFPVGAILQRLASSQVRLALVRATASEERYRLISQISSDYTFSTALDSEGNMYLNWVAGAFEEMTGYNYEEYVASGGWLAHLHPDDITRDEKDTEILKTNKPVITEVRTFKKDRELRWVRVYANPVWDEKENRLIGIVGAVQDITEQKQAEEALRKSESIYRRAIEVAGAVPYHQTFDAEGRIMYDFMGEGIRQITGYGPEEFSDDLWGTLVEERHLLGDLEPYELDQAIEQVRIGNIPIWKCEHRIKARDGEIRWVFEAAVDLRDEKGIAYGSVGLYQDVTEQKQAEEALTRERDLLQIFLDNIPDTVYFKDTASRFIRINKTQAKFLKLDHPEDAIGKTDLDFQSPELATKFMEEEKQIMEAGLSIANRIEFNPTEDGEPRWLSASKSPVRDSSGSIIGTIGISRDITNQKLAEDREANRRLFLEKILEIGKQVTETKDLPTTLERIWHGIHDVLGFDRLAIFLYNAERNSMDSMVGTTIDGKMENTSGIWFPIAEWTTFKMVLDKPDELFITHNYDVENNLPEGHEMYGVKDYAAVAAWAGDKPVAVICVDQSITKHSITDQQLEALRLFAGYAGLAIENARLNEALKYELEQQKRAEESEANRRAMLEKVVLLGQQVTEVKSLKTIIERIWRGVHDEIGFDRLAIFLYDQETNTVKGSLGTDDNGNIVEEWDYERTLDHEKPTSFMRTLEQPNGLFFTDNFSVEFDIPEGHDMYKVKDFASVAAWAGDKPVAIITVDNHPSGRPFTSAQLEALRLFGGYAGLAIQNSHLNAALEAELDQRQNLINELENKNAELERFTYTVSHDLKSPLVTITGFLGYLEKDAMNGNAERVRSSINRIAAAAKKMQSLLNDLLELSRIGRLMNAPENIPFGEIVHEAIDRVRGRLDEVNAMIEIQRDFPIVNGDRVRLVEVVQNLVENAVKYSNPQVRLRIEIGMDGQNERGCPIFHVRDNGIGIEPQFHERIFGLFNKLDVQSEGMGIGLSLVKRIIEVHNGRIWVESEIGKGATFYFSLPAPQTKE